MDKRILRRIGFIGKTEGESMIPLIYPKDGVYIKPGTASKLKVNDIITFEQQNKLITHRIIYKKSGYVITKGDNNPQSDGRIYPNAVIGKVYKIKRNGQVFSPESLYLIQSTLYFQEVIKIKRAFEKAKIDFVFLKGLPLYLYFEKSRPRRLYADCDVLIDKKDFHKAERILYAFRYIRETKKTKEIENNYIKTINGLIVIFDIHLEAAFLMTQFSNLGALYQQKLIDKLTIELLKTKRKVRIQGANFYFLSKNFQVVYLFLHFFHHNFRGASRLDFLDKIVRKSRLSTKNWQDIAFIINDYQLANFVYPAFMLLRKYYQTSIPKFFLASIKPGFTNLINLIDFKNLSVFDDESRIRAGVNRFKLIFMLSPQPFWKRLMIFFNPQVVYFGSKVLRSKIISSRR